MKQEDILFQSISVVRDDKTKPLDLSFLKEATFVETIDLSGPRLMLTFDDPESILRNDMKLKARDVLEVRIADIWGEDIVSLGLVSGIEQTLRFVIWTMPSQGNIVHFNCMEQNVDALKQPAKESILFTKKPAEAIIRSLAPGINKRMKQDVQNLPIVESYHLLPGMRPSKLLRQVALEAGAVCFFRRGVMVFKKLSRLYRLTPKNIYEYNNPKAEKQIINFQKINTKAVIKDRVERNVVGWDMDKGFVKSGKKTDKPPEFSSMSNKMTMAALSGDGIPIPCIDLIAAGNGSLVSGVPMELKWNMSRKDAPLDESLHPRVVIGTVAHFYSGQKYICRVKGVLPL